MITSNIIEKQNHNTINDANNSILIIGKADSDYKNKQICLFNNVDEVANIYGEDSELTKAFKEGKEIGADNIFLCNCYKLTDFIEVVDYIPLNEFNYVCPLINFSETFINKDTGETMYLSELYSNIFNESLVQIIFTDTHADYYENINHYLKDMNSLNIKFKETTFNKLICGENLCFVLNILQNYKYANVVLASILVQTQLKNYPQINVGDVVFDINNDDIFDQEIIYFAYNDISKTTIENFLNYHKHACPEKFVPIRLIVNIIKRALEFSNFKGSLFNAYKRILIEKQVKQIMDSFLTTLIEEYKLIAINYFLDEENMVIINIDLNIKPYNSIEEIELNMEV